MPDITATRPAAGAPIQSAWGGQVHDMLEGVQAGVVTVNITAGANAWGQAVVFPRAYSSPPVVVACQADLGTGNSVFWASVASITATGFTARLNRKDEATQGAVTTLPVHWVAVGTPA